MVPLGADVSSPVEAAAVGADDTEAALVEYKNVVGVGTATLLFKPDALVMTATPEEVLALHADFLLLAAVEVLALHADFLVLTGVVELENGAEGARLAAVEVLALQALFFVLEAMALEDTTGVVAPTSRAADEVITPAADEVISALVAGRLVAIVTLSAEVTLRISDKNEPGAAVETATGITVAVETETGATEVAVPEPDPPQVATAPPGAV